MPNSQSVKIFRKGRSKFKPLPEGLELVSREDWNAQPPNDIVSLATPVSYVRFTSLDGHPCDFKDACIKVLSKTQKNHMNNNMDDIAYNFMIGGDGRVYEGRGWEVEPERPDTYTFLTGKGIDIAYIGTFDKKHKPPKVIEKAATSLVNYGVDAGYIVPQYKELSYRE